MSIRNNISKKVNPFKHQSHRFNFPPFPKSLPLPFSVWNLGAHGTQGNQAINKSPNHPCLEVPWLPPSKQPSSFSKNLPWSLLVVGNAWKCHLKKSMEKAPRGLLDRDLRLLGLLLLSHPWAFRTSCGRDHRDLSGQGSLRCFQRHCVCRKVSGKTKCMPWSNYG